MKKVMPLALALLVLSFIMFSVCSLQKESTNPVQQSSAVSRSDCAPDWDPDVAYTKKDVVSYDSHEWKAKKNSTGITPGTNRAYWADQGACGGEDPPPDPPPEDPQRLQIFGAWHAGNDYCTWAAVRDMTEFAAENDWMINGNGGGPSVNLVILSFVNPLKLMNSTTDEGNLNGVPRGMTAAVVEYFKGAGIRVMLSIGGITYTDDWNTALATNPEQFATNAAEVAQALGVGIEIDYEESQNPDLTGLETFVSTYRSIIGYDATGLNHAARLTIDLAAGDRYLIGICEYATANWLTIDNPVLDYANAMVPARQPRADAAMGHWQEHVDGKPQYAPPIPPLAPRKFTGAFYLVNRKAIPECTDFNASLQKITGDYVQTVAPHPSLTGATEAGAGNGMLGYMFWAAGAPSTRKVSTFPPNTCEDGCGGAMTYFDIPFPMETLDFSNDRPR